MPVLVLDQWTKMMLKRGGVVGKDVPVYSGWCIKLVTILVPPWHLLHVKYEVANLAKELVLVDIPVGPVTARYVRIAVYQSHTGEVCRPKNGRSRIRISYELCKVVSLICQNFRHRRGRRTKTHTV